MGAWGTDLYADDLASDLRSTMSALCRLPKDGDELVGLVAELHEGVPEDPDDGPVFWLVVADQLQRRGIESPARRRALDIIDDGADLVRLERLGMSPGDLRRRRLVLAQLRDRLGEPPEPTARRTPATPQAHVVAPGEVYAFPVDDGANPVNPYLPAAQREAFVAAGWRTCGVARTGHALDHLAWCQLVAGDPTFAERPTLAAAVAALGSGRHGLGTLSRAHAERLGLELLGSSDEVPDVPPPAPRHAVDVTASNISAANVLFAWRSSPGSA